MGHMEPLEAVSLSVTFICKLLRLQRTEGQILGVLIWVLTEGVTGKGFSILGSLVGRIIALE
jgi:hypothetical protein